MPLNKLRRTYEERRQNLAEQLQYHKDELDLSQQHQLFGAIKEIEHFLKSIDYHRTLEADRAFDLDLSKEREWPVLRRTQKVMRRLGNGIVEVLHFTFVKIPLNIGRGIKGNLEVRRERRRIEEQVRMEVERRMQAEMKRKIDEVDDAPQAPPRDDLNNL